MKVGGFSLLFSVVLLIPLYVVTRADMNIQHDDQDDEILRPSLGVVMKKIGSMVISPHTLTLNFIIPFNKYNLSITELPDTLFAICDNQNMTNKFVNSICKHHLPSILLYHNMTTTWEMRIKALQQGLRDMADTTDSNSSSRPKRGLMVSGIGFALSTGIRALINLKRSNDLKKGMQMLKNNQILQGKSILSLRKSLAHYIRLDTKQQGAIYQNIQTIEAKADQTREEVSIILSNIMAATQTLDAKTITIPLLSKLTQLRAELAILCFSTLPEMYYKNLEFVKNLRDAQRGTLRQSLLSKERISKAVDLAIEHLTEWQPNYYLLNTNVNHFYKENRIKTSFGSKGVILQLPLEVVKRQTPIMALYKFSSVPIPFANSTTKMASQLDPRHKFIALTDSHYTLLNEEQLNTCHTPVSNNLTICPMSVPMVKLSQSSCLLSIVNNDKPEIIYKQCPILVNSISQFGPQILESRKNLIVFGVDSHYQIICDLDNQPQNMKSLQFAVIPKTLLCSCNIITSNYFLKAYLCEKTTPNNVFSTIEHPENILSDFIIDDIQKSISKIDLRPPAYNNATSAINASIAKLLAIGKSSIPKEDMHLNELKEHILSDIEQTILLDEKNQPKAIQTKEWFGGELWLLGLSFILSIVGTISSLCFCYIFIKQKQVTSVIGAGLLSQSASVYAASTDSIPEIKVQLIYLLIQAACTLALAIISYFLLQCIKYFFKIYSSAKIPTLNQELLIGYPKIILALQITSGTERVVLKMANLYGMVDEIKFIGHLEPRILGFRGSLLGGNLALTLGSGNPARLSCKNLFTPTPDSVPVPWNCVWKIKRLSRTQYTAKVILIDDYGIGYPLLQDTSAGYLTDLQIV